MVQICGDGGANMGTVVDESASKQLMGRRHLKVVTKLLHLKILLEDTRKNFWKYKYKYKHKHKYKYKYKYKCDLIADG